jgi:adenosylcobinamide kinase / adenosylcobinamide-phosphate guanylyltransferase
MILLSRLEETVKTLILGGAKSGKSSFAQNMAEQAEESEQTGKPKELIFVATAEVGDEEMADRVMAHQADRGECWTTIEEPLAVAEVLAKGQTGQIYLVDCLTLWLSNHMAAALGDDQTITAEISALVRAFEESPASVIMVANEVGLGIVPQNKLARHFRDLAGRLNQHGAQVADEVYFIAAGLPLKLK